MHLYSVCNRRATNALDDDDDDDRLPSEIVADVLIVIENENRL